MSFKKTRSIHTAAFVMAAEAVLTLGFNVAGQPTPDQLPHRNAPGQNQRYSHLVEERRETKPPKNIPAQQPYIL